MEDLDKDYILDQAMASIHSFKRATDVINSVHPDKSKRKTPVQKLKHLTEFINNEYDRINEEYNKFNKNIEA